MALPFFMKSIHSYFKKLVTFSGAFTATAVMDDGSKRALQAPCSQVFVGS
jgi:hypothetical protein